MTPIVRAATSADAPHCQRLETQARETSAGARGTEALFADYPQGMLSGAAGFTMVAEIDDVVVGYLTVRLARVGDDAVGTIVRVFVTMPARRIGIGDALIAGAKNQARDRGCVRIDALALPGDRETKNLYERNGLTARLIVAASNL